MWGGVVLAGGQGSVLMLGRSGGFEVEVESLPGRASRGAGQMNMAGKTSACKMGFAHMQGPWSASSVHRKSWKAFTDVLSDRLPMVPV